jgi:hypothetical protein
MSQTTPPAQGVLSAEAALAAIRAQRLQVRFFLLVSSIKGVSLTDQARRMETCQPQTSLARDGFLAAASPTAISECLFIYVSAFGLVSS